MHPLRTFFHEFEWIHVGLGLLGNLSFLIGSVLFLFDGMMTAGTWFFVVGAFGMLVGSVGSAVVKYAHEDADVHVDA